MLHIADFVCSTRFSHCRWKSSRHLVGFSSGGSTLHRVLGKGVIHCRTHSQYVSEYTPRTSNSAGPFDRREAELWKSTDFRRQSFCTCVEGWSRPKTWARIQELYCPWLWFRRWIQLPTLESKILANRLKFGRHFQQVRDGQADWSQTSHLFRCFDSPWRPSPTHKEWQQSKPPL